MKHKRKRQPPKGGWYKVERYGDGWSVSAPWSFGGRRFAKRSQAKRYADRHNEMIACAEDPAALTGTSPSIWR